MRSIVLLILVCCASFYVTPFCTAQEIYVPPDLEEWQQWVLHDQTSQRCPSLGAVPVCVWPGRLKLDVVSDGGTFSQSVEVLADTWFALPGNIEFWPLDVTVDGEPVPVTLRNDSPSLRLVAGKHSIRGTFRWQRIPDRLALANGTGLIDLTVEGEAVARPRWDNNAVWTRQGASQDQTQDDNLLDINVYRRIKDGAPAQMFVMLFLEIAGESREEVVGQLLPEGFAPMHMNAPLPARLDDQGLLTIQARPGVFRFEFAARQVEPLSSLVFSPVGEHWPQEEVWSYDENPALRATEVNASHPVDPLQAGVPDAWQELPAFRMEPGSTLNIVERQRGRSSNEKNRLSLNRSLWLDFDQSGFTARDVITGHMVRNWRLDTEPPFTLQSARQQDADGPANLLVTQLSDDGQQRGVEIRSPAVALTAFSRVDSASRSIPVSGWDARFDEVNTTLFVPPGHRLLGASGADYAAGAWLSKWNLLDFFLVLIVTVALWRLYTPWVGIVAMAALTLSVHEAGAPYWSWLNLLIAITIVKYLPQSRLRDVAKLYKLVSIVAIVLMLLPFVGNQLRYALYPQLELGGHGAAGVPPVSPSAVTVEQAAEDMADIVAIKKARRSVQNADQLDEVVVTGSKRNVLNRYDKNARVQAGPGEPTWNWRSYRLRWSGPIDVEQTTRLFIVPAWAMSAWRVVMVLLIGVLLGAMIKRADAIKKIASRYSGTASALVLMSTIGVMGTLSGHQVYADTPDTELLKQLKERLLAPAECSPRCVNLSRAKLSYSADALSIELVAHVQGGHTQIGRALALPGRVGTWIPGQVTINGATSERLRLTDKGGVMVYLDDGVHRIGLQGALPNVNSVTIGFPLSPYYVEASGVGWEVTGIDRNRLSGGALTLIRQRGSSDSSQLDAIDVEQFPAFVTVNRLLTFDLDWSVQTTVIRRAPKTAAINVNIPLLPGELVTSENVVVIHSNASVAIPAGQNQISWESNLARTPTIELSAAANAPWQESWQIVNGANWRLTHAGVPELNQNDTQDGIKVARFAPWPGETLQLQLERPIAVDGETLAIDAAQLIDNIGKRSRTSNLNFTYRATRGGQHAIKFVQEIELSQVTIDGQRQSLVMQGQELRLPIVPGKHAVDISWRSKEDGLFSVASQLVDLNIAASNLNSEISLPGNRWVLWTGGPTLGPAVLYWSELLVLVAVAFLLGKYARTPLKFVHWLLLGLGFSTFFWPSFVVVTAAILVLSWRQNTRLEIAAYFNLTQILIAILVIAAGLALITTIPYGLLGSPNMHVTGNFSSAHHLKWFTDRSDGAMPIGTVFSAPLWVYKALILVWALWLAFAMLRWIPWMWQAFSNGGYWARKIIQEPEGIISGSAQNRVPSEHDAS